MPFLPHHEFFNQICVTCIAYPDSNNSSRPIHYNNDKYDAKQSAILKDGGMAQLCKVKSCSLPTVNEPNLQFNADLF